MSILNNLNIVSTLKQASKYSCGDEWAQLFEGWLALTQG